MYICTHRNKDFICKIYCTPVAGLEATPRNPRVLWCLLNSALEIMWYAGPDIYGGSERWLPWVVAIWNGLLHLLWTFLPQILQTFPQNPQESAERRLYLKSFGVPNHALPRHIKYSRNLESNLDPFGPFCSIWVPSLEQKSYTRPFPCSG